MSNQIRITYNNLWKKGSIDVSNFSQHPQFPMSETSIDTLDQFFRSRYGTGSGNGLFFVSASNNKINFQEAGGELTATLTNGGYNGQTLATEIKTRLDVAGALTYTVTYSETTAKFSISASGSFTLLWNTGTLKTTDISDLCGYDDAADDGPGAGPFVSDDRRIHHPYEAIGRDLGAAYQYDHVGIFGHTISSSATITLQGADSANYGTGLVQDTIPYNANNIFEYISAARTKRYVRIKVADPDNPSSYWQVSTIVLGKFWEPNQTYMKGFRPGRSDESESERSDSLNEYSDEKPILKKEYFPFINLNETAKDTILTFFETVGTTRGFIVCLDPDNPNSSSYFMKNNELIDPENVHKNLYTWEMDLREVK